ncbi:hypothetical protein HDE_10392 [Halotydeus destructor]|nr:hypothetical protein HDE_10392 [Halotydeus destructor]
MDFMKLLSNVAEKSGDGPEMQDAARALKDMIRDMQLKENKQTATPDKRDQLNESTPEQPTTVDQIAKLFGQGKSFKAPSSGPVATSTPESKGDEGKRMLRTVQYTAVAEKKQQPEPGIIRLPPQNNSVAVAPTILNQSPISRPQQDYRVEPSPSAFAKLVSPNDSGQHPTSMNVFSPVSRPLPMPMPGHPMQMPTSMAMPPHQSMHQLMQNHALQMPIPRPNITMPIVRPMPHMMDPRISMLENRLNMVESKMDDCFKKLQNTISTSMTAVQEDISKLVMNRDEFLARDQRITENVVDKVVSKSMSLLNQIVTDGLKDFFEQLKSEVDGLENGLNRSSKDVVNVQSDLNGQVVQLNSRMELFQKQLEKNNMDQQLLLYYFQQQQQIAQSLAVAQSGANNQFHHM